MAQKERKKNIEMTEKVKAEVKPEWEDDGDEQENCVTMKEAFFLVGKQEEKNSSKNKQQCAMEK